MGSVRATTFELLPERIDLVGLVLSSAGLGALVGSFFGRARNATREKRAGYAEDLALFFAGSSAIAFLLLAPIQALT